MKNRISARNKALLSGRAFFDAEGKSLFLFHGKNGIIFLNSAG
jgi:hypothetical protein